MGVLSPASVRLATRVEGRVTALFFVTSALRLPAPPYRGTWRHSDLAHPVLLELLTTVQTCLLDWNGGPKIGVTVGSAKASYRCSRSSTLTLDHQLFDKTRTIRAVKEHTLGYHRNWEKDPANRLRPLKQHLNVASRAVSYRDNSCWEPTASSSPLPLVDYSAKALLELIAACQCEPRLFPL